MERERNRKRERDSGKELNHLDLAESDFRVFSIIFFNQDEDERNGYEASV